MTATENIPVADISTTTVRAACAHDCPDTCACVPPRSLLQRRTVADAMVTDVKVHHARTTVREIRALFDDVHVHAAVIIEAGRLLAVVDRSDLDAADDDNALAVHLGGRRRRVITPGTDLAWARQVMLTSGRRRLAVVDGTGKVHGLLCLKRTRSGFCSDRDVRARSTDRLTR